jgi:hypothetical protein
MQDLEREFRQRLSDFLKQRDLDIKYKVIAQPQLRPYSQKGRRPGNINPDFLITKGGYPFMVVEITGRNRPMAEWLSRYRFSVSDMHELGLDYFVVTDLEKFIIIEGSGGEYFESENFESFFDVFQEADQNDINHYAKQIMDIIRQTVEQQYTRHERPVEQKLRLLKLLGADSFRNSISYNHEGRFFHFASNAEAGLQDFENLFFQNLLEEVKETVCRYTSMDTLFHTLNGSSFRMGSHLAMNDRGEMDYVDKYVGAYYKPIDSMTMAEMQQMNGSFISSCTESSNEDDLTMYRLYGDDSKGVCLRFAVTSSIQNKYMLIRKISYGTSRTFHFELELIRAIIGSISATLSARFKFLYLDIWKHFFKSYDYKMEQEVRLLYVDNQTVEPKKRDWVIVHPDRIISKYVLFELGDKEFPLQLEKIILGPNLPEKALNQKQVELLLEEKKVKGVQVTLSEIESYRKS